MKDTACPEIDSLHFRQVLGHYPTGVTVVTGVDESSEPVAMVIGSFTSVSLDPPLVAFLPAKKSATFVRLRSAATFCVNILGANSEELARIAASKTHGSFSQLEWHRSATGAPILDRAIAWIECRTHDIVEAGDHYIVIGRVLALSAGETGLPLIFFRGGYGRFSPTSLVAPPQPDMTAEIRLAHIARPEMERVSQALGLEVTCSAAIDNHLVMLASAGNSDGASSWVGLRSPSFPPMNTIYMAWSPAEKIDAWLAQLDEIADSEVKERLRHGLDLVRDRGWSFSLAGRGTKELDEVYKEIATTGLTVDAAKKVRGLLSTAAGDFNCVLTPGVSYPIRVVSAPIFGPDGEVCLTLQLRCNGYPMTTEELLTRVTLLVSAADRISQIIGGRRPRYSTAIEQRTGNATGQH